MQCCKYWSFELDHQWLKLTIWRSFHKSCAGSRVDCSFSFLFYIYTHQARNFNLCLHPQNWLSYICCWHPLSCQSRANLLLIVRRKCEGLIRMLNDRYERASHSLIFFIFLFAYDLLSWSSGHDFWVRSKLGNPLGNATKWSLWSSWIAKVRQSSTCKRTIWCPFPIYTLH